MAKPSTAPHPASTKAMARLPGVDVARALAVLGMVLVNYKMKMGADMRGPDWLVWLSSLIDGRAAALFVVLAGVSLSLRSRRICKQRDSLACERIVLFKRAAVLFGAGLVNLHMWELDILHFYGVYLAFAAIFLHVRGSILWVIAGGCIAVEAVLQSYVDFIPDASFWSLRGLLVDLFFGGLHPVFPWMAFLFVGMWLGRQDLSHPRTCHRILGIAFIITVFCAGFNTWVPYRLELLVLKARSAEWLIRVSLPGQTLDVVSATGTAVMAICGCILGTRQRAACRWVAALVATGQLALTLYLAHAVAILIPLQHELLEEGSLALSIGYSLAFYTVAVTLSVWWRRRWLYGPLEGLMRQITGQTIPAPWSGSRRS